MKNKSYLIAIAALSLGLMAVPAYAQETEAYVSDAEVLNDITTDVADDTITIRIKSNKEQEKDFWWQAYSGDKGDASFMELVTETDMEDGYAYVGSFRAIDDGTDTIRLVYTNGHYTREYLDFGVEIEDGIITGMVRGGQTFETRAEDLAPVLEGVWEETEGGTHSLEIALADDGGLSFTVSDGSGRDGNVVYYTMTAYYDAIEEALVYWDGTQHSAVISAEDETEAESEGSTPGEGTGLFAIQVPSSEDTEEEEAELGILWKDDTFGNTDTNMFVKLQS